MSKIVNYIKNSYDELMHKVSWPTMSELTNSTVVVFVASLIIALIIFAMFNALIRVSIFADVSAPNNGLSCFKILIFVSSSFSFFL